MSTEEEPTGDHGRPLADLWLHPVIPYGFAYSVAVMVNAAVVEQLLANWLGKPAIHFTFPPPLSCFAGIEPFVISWCFVRLRKRWDRAVEVGTLGPAPSWSLIGIGIISGCAAGLLLAGAVMIPIESLRAILLLLISLAGPLPAMWWIIERKLNVPDLDYDERMRPNGPTRLERIELADLRATEAFGHRLGEHLFPNAIVALIGPLGAGKTHLSRAIAEGLGIANSAAVTSPTFTLIHEYPARLPIYHFDAYRLNGANEFLDLGVSEYFEAGGVCLIEWADKVESALPEERLTIRLVPIDEARRRAELTAVGERYEALVRQL